MKGFHTARLAPASLAVVLCGAAFAQSPVTILERYGISASWAVASEGPAGTPHPGVGLVFAAMGSTVCVLDGTAAQPTLWSGATENVLACDGFVKDITYLRNGNIDALYAASTVGGLRSFNMLGNLFAPSNGFPYQVSEDFWSVAAVDIDDSGSPARLVFAGSNVGDTGGSIHVIRHNPLNVQHKTTFSAGAPVYTLTASTSLRPGHVVLFAGTACQGLLRFDIPNANLLMTPAPPLPAPTVWNPLDAQNNPTFVRDVIVSEAEGVAFAAAHGKGVHRFDVSSAGSLVPTGSPWPILVQDMRYDSLAFAFGGSFLVVGGGAHLAGERQHYGECSKPIACDGSSDAVPATYGIWAYELSGTPYASAYTFLDRFKDVGRTNFYAYSIATRPDVPALENDHIDVAFGAQG